MTTHLMANSKVTLAALALMAGTCAALPAGAQNFPISAAQKHTATQVAQQGIPLSELSANAPDRYTVKGGDTLWAISSLFLKSPWRWPELWGMNLDAIKNPHLIYPGQQLVLERKNGMATLRVAGAHGSDGGDGIPTVRLSPRTRATSLAEAALPTLKPSLIEPFLVEPMVLDEQGLQSAPRIVAATENRVLLTRGDRAYARGPDGAPLMDDQPQVQQFRIFRNATPLKDPGTGEVLGYEAQYVGKAALVRGESTMDVADKDGTLSTAIVPATIDIVRAKEEIRVGDRMFPEPEREWQTYVPQAPDRGTVGRIVSVYGSAVVNAAQGQVVTINRGSRDGIVPGHVMAILKDGARVVDKSDAARPLLKLPNERNGLLMVFRSFERVSYALVLEITDGVRVGDHLASPH